MVVLLGGSQTAPNAFNKVKTTENDKNNHVKYISFSL